MDEMVIDSALAKAVADAALARARRRTRRNSQPCSPASTGPERRLDLMLRLGPYGDGFGAEPRRAHPGPRCSPTPHGIDLGPLAAAPAEVLRTPQRHGSSCCPRRSPTTCRGCAPPLRRRGPPRLVLVGRRHLRSNNSWLHNLPALNGGSNRCTLQIHPEDAAPLGLTDGAGVRIKAARRRDGGPRGDHRRHPQRAWSACRTAGGTTAEATRQTVAEGQPGVNVNQLNDGHVARSVVGDRGVERDPGADQSGCLGLAEFPDHRHGEADRLLAGRHRHGCLGHAVIPGHRCRRGNRAARLGDRETLPRSSPDNCAYCWARFLASSKARRGRP